jgi:hypothetical protein
MLYKDVFDLLMIFHKQVITNSHVGGIMSGILLIDIILLVVWFVVEPVGEVRTDADYDPALFTAACWVVPDDKGGGAGVEEEAKTPSTVLMYIFALFKILLLIFGVIVLFQMRNVKFHKGLTDFNEIKYLSFNLCNWFFTLIIIAALLYSETNPRNRYVLKSFGLLWCCLATLLILFAPKFTTVFYSKVVRRLRSASVLCVCMCV